MSNGKRITFTNGRTGKRLGSVTVQGTFKGEVKTTAELLAYENNVRVSEIVITVE